MNPFFCKIRSLLPTPEPRRSEVNFKQNYESFLKKYDVEGHWGLPADTVWEQLNQGITQAARKMKDLPTVEAKSSNSYKRVLYNEHDTNSDTSLGNASVGDFQELTAAERARRLAAGEDIIEIPDIRFTKSPGFKDAQKCLQPFLDSVGALMALAFETATRSQDKTGNRYPCIFWSFCGARDCALKWCKANGGGIVMNNTIGMLMNGVDVTQLGDPQLKHWPGEIWVSFSEIYARLAAVNANKLRFINFIGPGADQSESVWEQMESRTLSQIATTLYNPVGANASGLPEVMVREWYVVPTHIKIRNGKETVMWNKQGYLQKFTSQAAAFNVLPSYTKQQLQNSFILLV